MKDLVQRFFFGMGKSKVTPICPYVFHLYHSHGYCFRQRRKEYRIKEALLKHNVESEGEKDPEDPEEAEDSEDSDRESLSFGEVQEIQKQEVAWLKKSPLNKRRSSAAKEPVVKHKTPTPLEGPD